MAITLGGRGMVSPEINLTSLIDVLLVLLIIFMILPPSAGEPVEIPQRADASVIRPPEKDIVIHLQETIAGQRPALKINESDVGWDQLEAELQKIYLRRMEKVAFLKGDPDIDFEYVAEVIDMTRHAGVVHVGLMGTND